LIIVIQASRRWQRSQGAKRQLAGVEIAGEPNWETNQCRWSARNDAGAVQRAGNIIG